MRELARSILFNLTLNTWIESLSKEQIKDFVNVNMASGFLDLNFKIINLSKVLLLSYLEKDTICFLMLHLLKEKRKELCPSL